MRITWGRGDTEWRPVLYVVFRDTVVVDRRRIVRGGRCQAPVRRGSFPALQGRHTLGVRPVFQGDLCDIQWMFSPRQSTVVPVRPPAPLRRGSGPGLVVEWERELCHRRRCLHLRPLERFRPGRKLVGWTPLHPRRGSLYFVNVLSLSRR